MDNYEKIKVKLDKSGVKYEILETGTESLSLDDNVRTLGISYREGVGTLLIKNDKGEYFALLRRDDRQINKKKLFELIGTDGFEFCKEKDLKKLGFDAGLVSPLLLHDSENHKVQVLVDKCVKEGDYVYCGVARANATLKIRQNDLLSSIGEYKSTDFTEPNPERQGLAEHESAEKTVYTADTPTGQLHIGHYVGSLENRLKLQEKYKCYFGLANYHSYSYMKRGESLFKNPDFINKSTLEVAMDNLAVGIDPEKAVFYIESEVPETCELAILFSMLVKHTRALRNPTIKDEIVMKKMGDKFSLGFVNYPMLQAADILLFKADLVPVGEDQLAHIEQSREIARDFNKAYGDTFPVPQGLVGKVGVLPGIDNKKMSKSLDNSIVFTDSDENIKTKIKSMYTDPNRIHSTDPGKIEGNPVFIYHDAFNLDKDEVSDLKKRYKKGKVGDVEVKEKLAQAMIEFIAPIRERRKKLEEDPAKLLDILMQGSKKARKVACTTMNEVREKMKLVF
ncbi:MAG: tryptophan--tRNA ligase [Patescibacteria group bacterium]|nr:tryptophan--tRNA ligase [Patescibacteria group bacterium]